MVFQSFEFVFLFICLLLLISIVPKKYRVLVLLAFSYYYYLSFNYFYIIILLLATLITFYTTLRISNTINPTKKKILLISNILICLSFLIYFKVCSSFNVSPVFSNILFKDELNYLIPIGISFYTFQLIGYLADIYNSKIKAENNLIDFALYTSFFPQVLAGPIERAKDLLPQLKNNIQVNKNSIYEGFKYFLWGFFKKALVADKLALIANPILDNPIEFQGIQIVMGVLAYSFQIYCDFSGYCDMAVGLAKMLGIELSTNFYYPYIFSKSFREFWQRWHITLTRWLRAYIYIPLGGNQKQYYRYIINIFIIFLISGLWHGITITFILWGVLHFFYFISERIIYDNTTWGEKIPDFIKQILVFVLVSFTWIFFRSPDLITIKTTFTQIFTLTHNSFAFQGSLIHIGSLRFNIIQILSIILPFITFLFFEFSGLIQTYFSNNSDISISYVELALINLVFIFAILFIVEPSQQFIYFKF